MDSDFVTRYEKLMSKADTYHRRALWQEKLRVLQEAFALCSDPSFSDGNAYIPDLSFELGGVRRRLGQYQHAESTLKQSLTSHPDANPLKRGRLFGELGVVLRLSGRYPEAIKMFQMQESLARQALPAFEAEIELCRVIGNQGMVFYNLAQQTQPCNLDLVKKAIIKLEERIKQARQLQARFLSGSLPEDQRATKIDIMRLWETVGRDRMTLCYISLGKTLEAVRIAEISQRNPVAMEPSVTAASRFYYGNALWHNGQKEDALRQWNAPSGTCSAPIVFCKEPASEHTEYLMLMASAGVDFDSYDEQGFDCLDYAYLCDEIYAKEIIPIIIDSLSEKFRRDLSDELPGLSSHEVACTVADEVSARKQQSELRRYIRNIFQETFRPILRRNAGNAFQQLRESYTTLLSQDTHAQLVLNQFHYMRYSDFKKFGRLPVASQALSQDIPNVSQTSILDRSQDYVVFFSYRWIGGELPDNKDNFQWRRMIDAAEQFLRLNKDVDEDRLGIWLDYVCINQEDEHDKRRGVNTLPLAVTLCNAMISLIDESYYDRAWCAVEVMLMRALMESYGHHHCWEHVLDFPQTTSPKGSLGKSPAARSFDVANLKLTKEKQDRPRIDFLWRQSKLLGKDDA